MDVEQNQSGGTVSNDDVVKQFRAEFDQVKAQNETLVKEMNKVLRENAEIRNAAAEKDLQLSQAVSELSRQSARPTIEQEIRAEMERARANGDLVLEAQLSAKLDSIESKRAALGTVFAMANMAATNLAQNLSEEERSEFFKSIYVNGDPNRGFLSVELMQNFGLVGPRMAEDAKARIVARKVWSGDYDRQVEKRIADAEKARQDALASQAGITAGGGGAPSLTQPVITTPAESYEDQVRREIIEMGKSEKGVMRHPVPK